MKKEERSVLVKAFLTVFAAFLVFGGPTYLPLIIKREGTPSLLLNFLGLVVFIAGVIALTIIIKRK